MIGWVARFDDWHQGDLPLPPGGSWELTARDNAQTVTDLHLDCYAILGVRPDAGEIVIHEAFETLTQQYDPEHFAGSKDEAHRKLSDLASAYAILSDPVRRRRYDLRRRIDALIAPLSANDAPRQKGVASCRRRPLQRGTTASPISGSCCPRCWEP